MLNVFDYNDYRILLGDLYKEKKDQWPAFSYRYICTKVGFASAGFFTNILNGKRNISDELIFKFAELFNFSRVETEFFELLVHYDQSKDPERRKYYHDKMIASRKSAIRELTAEQNEYFSTWYNVKNENNTYIITDKTVTSGPQTSLASIHHFQRATMNLAQTAIERFDKNDRSISTLTLNVSCKQFKVIEEKLAEFRLVLLEMAKNDPECSERVYQFNFQIFPLTKCFKGSIR
jgi:plasmid maintenance system antidote protein VapI